MQPEILTFEQFMATKGIVKPESLPPKIAARWREEYAREVLAAQPSSTEVVNLRIKAGLITDETIELKGTSEAELQITCEPATTDGKEKLPTFAMTAYTGAPMHPGGWYRQEPIVVDIAGMNIPSQNLPIDHAHGTYVGHSTAVEKTPGNMKLKARGVLSGYSKDADHPPAKAAREIAAMASNGFPYQASIDATVHKLEKIDAGQKVTVNGQSFSGPLYVARASTLKGVAILADGADSNTQTAIAAQRGDPMNPQFLAWLQANDYPEAPQGEQLARLLARWEKGKQPPAVVPVATVVTPPIDPAIEIRAKAAAEMQRVADITKVCKDFPNLEIEIEANGVKSTVNLQAHAVASGWSKIETELAFVRATRAPSIIVRDHDRDCNADALSAQLLLRAGVRLDSPTFARPEISLRLPVWLRAGVNVEARQKVMESGHRFADMSMLDLARESLRIAGKDAPHNRGEMIKAAFSGGTLTNIFTSNINTVVTSAYLEAPDTTSAWTRTTDVADFKVNERPRLQKEGGALSPLPRGQTADHGKRADSGESYKISRFAEQIVIDEQDLIDDRFNAFSDISPEMGRKAARNRPDGVYSILLANPDLAATNRALFNSTDANLNTGAALADSTLKAAISTMRVVQENGVNLNIQPTHFIGPTALDFTIRQLLQSSMIVLGGTSSGVVAQGNVNTLQGLLTPISDARLDNGVTDPLTDTTYGGSATTWFLASTQVPTIEVAYLRGTGRAPVVRSFNLMQGQYGIGWDICLDIGSKAMDWRGVQKNTA